MKKSISLVVCFMSVLMASAPGAEVASTGVSSGQATHPGYWEDAIAQWASQPSAPPPPAGTPMRPGAKVVEPPPDEPAVPLEILIKLKERSAAGEARFIGSSLTLHERAPATYSCPLPAAHHASLSPSNMRQIRQFHSTSTSTKTKSCTPTQKAF